MQAPSCRHPALASSPHSHQRQLLEPRWQPRAAAGDGDCVLIGFRLTQNCVLSQRLAAAMRLENPFEETSIKGVCWAALLESSGARSAVELAACTAGARDWSRSATPANSIAASLGQDKRFVRVGPGKARGGGGGGAAGRHDRRASLAPAARLGAAARSRPAAAAARRRPRRARRRRRRRGCYDCAAAARPRASHAPPAPASSRLPATPAAWPRPAARTRTPRPAPQRLGCAPGGSASDPPPLTPRSPPPA